jgi:predicted glycosyltransferase
VEKDDQHKFEKIVLQWLNPYFDGVLVHSDPGLIRFEQTFARTADIACPLYYTGYVAQGSLLPDRAAARRELGLSAEGTLLLASAGSGTVGGKLLSATIGASIHLGQRLPHRLLMFHGPHAEQELRHRLHKLANGHGHIKVGDFTANFVDHVLAADLSISMAGYNTTMNLLACRTPGLLLPFDQNREQRMRLEALVGEGELESVALAERLRLALLSPPPGGAALRLDGDRESAVVIRRLMEEHHR